MTQRLHGTIWIANHLALIACFISYKSIHHLPPIIHGCRKYIDVILLTSE